MSDTAHTMYMLALLALVNLPVIAAIGMALAESLRTR